jgi:hypothetical protein
MDIGMTTEPLLSGRYDRHRDWSWFLMLVVLVQSMTFTVLRVSGPLHAHPAVHTQAPASAGDRNSDAIAYATTSFHSHADGQRHHHDADDHSVEVLRDDLSSENSTVLTSLAGGGFLPLTRSAGTYGGSVAKPPLVPGQAWVALTHDRATPDRPPKDLAELLI